MVFFVTDRFLGDKRFSYNQHLSFDLRIGEDGARATRYDVVLEGDGYRASVPIYSQGNPVPRTISQTFNFRLSEHSDFQWSPQLDSFSFIRMLSNLTAIKIKAHYTDGGMKFPHLRKLKFLCILYWKDTETFRHSYACCIGPGIRGWIIIHSARVVWLQLLLGSSFQKFTISHTKITGHMNNHMSVFKNSRWQASVSILYDNQR